MVMTETPLDAALREANQLGLMPCSVGEIQRIADDPRSSLKDLEKALALDPMLAARILKFANTAHYGRSRQITALKQAVVILGMRAVRDVAIGMAVAARADDILKEEAAHYLQHSLYTAVVSMVLEISGSQASHDAFVSGLLHNMGNLIMVALDADKHAKIRAAHPREDLSSCMAETIAYGFNHCDLAAECLDRWGLPGRVVHAVRNHHDPSPKDKPTALLCLADVVAIGFIEGAILPDLVTLAHDSAANRVLGLPEAKLNARLRRVREMVGAFGPLV